MKNITKYPILVGSSRDLIKGLASVSIAQMNILKIIIKITGPIVKKWLKRIPKGINWKEET